MSRIRIVSASAGTGKTHHITQVLKDRIRTGAARPDKVVATTFTIKAAAELSERVRRALLEEDMVEAARALQAARIGTVHSICAELIQDHAFEAGLSPQLRILDEFDARALLEKVLAEVLDEDRHLELLDVCRRMDKLDWESAVRELVACARTNRIDASALRASIPRSVEGALALLARPADDAAAVEAPLCDAVDDFVAACATNGDATQKTQEILDLARRFAGRLRRAELPPWRDWIKLAKCSPAKKSKDAFGPVHERVARYDTHPRLHADVRCAVELVVGAAATALEHYEAHKRDRGVLDFDDLEAHAVALLEDASVRAQLKGEVDLLLVDEFQDTSPIQLALFAHLADLAAETIWVGDQKQSIYGFRGADPTLMDAALRALQTGQDPETLSESWRTLPPLVAATSMLFAPSFDRQGIPRERVEITSTGQKSWPDLGPVFEHWTLTAKNAGEDVASLVSCIDQLLDDPSVRVRDRATGAPRPLRPEDVAVLCRTNDSAAAVAEELGNHDLAADTARKGLVGTSEVRCALAALRLLLDPSDVLARSTLARFLLAAEPPQAWLDALSAARAAEGAAGGAPGTPRPFDDLPGIRAVVDAGFLSPSGAATSALDRAIEALDLLELCRRWGDTDRRLRNLEILRAHAEHFERSAVERGRAATPAALLLHLEALDDDTPQAPLFGASAVHVGTWHTAKGLEWPVVVLFDLNKKSIPSALGVHVEPAADGFDLTDPLRGRWLRFWPQPFDPNNNGQDFHERLDATPEQQRIRSSDADQQLRLLYVGWTRARDRLVLAARPGKLTDGILAHLADPDGPPALDDSGAWAGGPDRLVTRTGAPSAPTPSPPRRSEAPVPRPRTVHPPATVRPSDLRTVVADTSPGADSPDPIRIGDRIPLSGAVDMARLGDAIHAFLAADDHTADLATRTALAESLLTRFSARPTSGGADAPDVPGTLPLLPRALVTASDNLHAWATTHHPDATWHREWPVLASLPDGSILRGAADLVLRTPDHVVVLDHKSFPGNVTQSLARARTHAAQLTAYADAVRTATGARTATTLVHLPVSGLLVPVGAQGDDAAAGRT